MKKVFYLVAVATLAFISCQKQDINPTDNDTPGKPLTFKASIEQLAETTKATINNDNQLVWAENDLIGIYFPDWGDKNQPFRLDAADAGQTDGTFTIATAANPSGASATAAYFPWWDTEGLSPDYPSSSQTNVYEGVVYFKMKEEYHGYSNGRMLTPLVAPITSSSDNIAFKHAGAAVKVTTSLPVSGDYYAKMSVTGKQITGDFHVNPANAGTDALALDATEDATQNHVTLHTWASAGSFNWIFPVPELTKPKLQFEITDKNGVPVWSKNLKAQANDLNRGDILVFPSALTTPYEKFVQDNATSWHFHGTINGSSWVDAPMVTDGKYWILAGCTFADGDEFKINKGDDWYPSSNWHFTAALAGTKDIIFNSETKEIQVVAHSYPYPESFIPSPTVAITIDGTMTDWDACTTESTNSSNNYRVFKATYDKDYIYLYTKRVTVSGQRYIYYDFDTDNNSATGTSEDSRNGLEAYMALVLYAGTSIVASPGADKSYPDANVYSGVVCAGVYASDFTETEVSIPRSNLGINKGDTIKIYSWGNKSADGVASHPITLRIGN